MVDNHGGQRRHRIKAVAVDDKNANVERVNAGLLQQVIDGGEDYQLSLLSRSFHRRHRLRFEVVSADGESRFLAEARFFEDSDEERGDFLAEDIAGVLGEGGVGDAVVFRGLEAGEVNEVDWRPAVAELPESEVSGGKDDEGGEEVGGGGEVEGKRESELHGLSVGVGWECRVE